MVYFWDLLGDHAERWAKPFLGHNWAQKPWNCPKKLSRKLLVVESWLIPQNDCKAWFLWVFWDMYTSQTAASALIRHLFWFFGALWWQICMIIHILWTSGHIKLVDLSKWSQEWIYYRYSGICIPLKQLEVPQKCFFFVCIFGALDDKISQVSISWELYILKWLTFKMTKNDHSITV